MSNEEKLKKLSRKKLAKFICGLIYEAGSASCEMCKFNAYCSKECNGVYTWLGEEKGLAEGDDAYINDFFRN